MHSACNATPAKKSITSWAIASRDFIIPANCSIFSSFGNSTFAYSLFLSLLGIKCRSFQMAAALTVGVDSKMMHRCLTFIVLQMKNKNIPSSAWGNIDHGRPLFAECAFRALGEYIMFNNITNTFLVTPVIRRKYSGSVFPHRCCHGERWGNRMACWYSSTSLLSFCDTGLLQQALAIFQFATNTSYAMDSVVWM